MTQQKPITRRSFLGSAASAGLVLATGGITSLTSIAATPEPALAAQAGFSSFDASSPYAKPSFLVCEDNWWGPEPDNIVRYASSYMYTSGGTYWDSDIFLMGGRPYYVFGMEYSDNWFYAEWANVGSYYGRRVGCRMTVSDPVHVDNYNGWGRPSGWDGLKLEERYGARHFFVLGQTFCSALSHWMCGLAHIKQRFEFFYTDDPSRTAINIDWAYYKCESVQYDGGGAEWASPGANWQGHAFIPKGVNNSSAYWTTGLFWGWNVVSTWEGGVNERCSFMFDYSGKAIEFHRGDTAGWDGYTWSFTPYDTFHQVTLSKRSSNPTISDATGSYSLAGAVYGVYLDQACTVSVGTITTDAKGTGTLAAVNGTSYLIANNTYYIKESKAPAGFLLDTQVHAVYLDGDKVLSLTEIPKTATVRFYVDGDTTPIHIDEERPLGSMYEANALGVQRASIVSTKPNCTPGLDAWYTDKALTQKYVGSVLNGDLDLYARNVATLTYEVALGSKLTPDLPVHETMDETSKVLGLYADILPSSREANWGSTVALKEPKYLKLYWHDSERWRTLRKRDTGWHKEQSAADVSKSTQKIEQDTTVYADYAISTFDGIVVW